LVDAERLKSLAQLLSEVETVNSSDDLDPKEASLHQVARLIQRDNLPAAMDGLLDILREDKGYRDGLPKDALLGLFSLLGDEDPLTRRYRDELASILF
jgi:putative thioredoxin